MRSSEGGSRRSAIDDLIASRTAAWIERERASLDAVIAALSPSARHLTDVLDWLDEIAAREGARPATALDDPDLQAALRARGSAPDRLKRWKTRLRRMRFPRLAAREAEIASSIDALELGAAVTVTPPPNLEGGLLTVTLRARSSSELAAAVERLRTPATSEAFDRVFALLAEL